MMPKLREHLRKLFEEETDASQLLSRACSEEVIQIILSATENSLFGCEIDLRRALEAKIELLLEEPPNYRQLKRLAELLHSAFKMFAECMCRSPTYFVAMSDEITDGGRAPHKLRLAMMMQALVEAYPSLPALSHGDDAATVFLNCETLKSFFADHGPEDLMFCREIEKKR